MVRQMPDVRDYELPETIEIDDARRMKALGDPLRMRITELVLERAMSVTDLAERLGRPKGTVGYHVDVLMDAGLLQVVRTRKVRAVEERFYGRAARTYMIPGGPKDGVPFLDDYLRMVDLDHWAKGGPGTATIRRARIPAARAAEYADRLEALALEFIDEPRDGDEEFGIYVALFPTRIEEDA